MEVEMLRRKILVVALGGVLALPACGGGGSSPAASTATPAPAPTPAPCTQTFLVQGSSPIPSRILLSTPITAGTAGRLDVILDWTFADSPIGVYVTQGSCNLDQFNSRTCNFVIRSESGAKPRKVSGNVTAGNYEFLVANFASRDESASTQVILSSSSCPAITSGAQTAAAQSGTAQVRSLLKLSGLK
jgi:hypothetical protein